MNQEKQPAHPHEYDRRILVAVSGLSPAILTETVYGLSHPQNEPAFIPTEIHLITTSTGKEQAIARLLNGENPAFAMMLNDYPDLQNIQFDENHIHVITDDNNREINDLVDQADNEAAADYICNKIFEYTRDISASVHVSIAGGRKTMGFYVGYALSLFGRSQDRLSHVLVSYPYELCKNFYYPTPLSKTGYYEQNGKDLAADFKYARVDLAQIPFVRITNLMKLSQYNKLPIVNGKISYSQTIKFAEASASATMEVELNPENWELTINGIRKRVNKTRKVGLVFLSVFLETMARDGVILVLDKKQYSKEWRELFIARYEELTDAFAADEKDAQIDEKGMSYDKFNDLLSKARQVLKDHFGLDFAEQLLPKPADGVFRAKDIRFRLV